MSVTSQYIVTLNHQRVVTLNHPAVILSAVKDLDFQPPRCKPKALRVFGFASG